jgi:hypothetical protein
MIEAPTFDVNTLPRSIRPKFGDKLSPQAVENNFRVFLELSLEVTPYPDVREKLKMALESLQKRKQIALEIARIRSGESGDSKGWFVVAEALSWQQLQLQLVSTPQH